ncbi:hypothetical protein A6E05_18775 [Aliivibrio sp. 1S165]|nr:hypothetical protein A6E05_18775 [Aliivibrio sp. 1S165]OCH34319.1 hypothetical protein A6E06_00355 [Aliivibrio sp. 1S175]
MFHFKSLPSMFARLYFGLIISIITTLLLFFTFAENYMRKADIDVFLKDGDFFLEQYVKQKDKENSLYDDLENSNHEVFYIFTLKLISHWDKSPPCHGCDQIFIKNSTVVYVNESGLYSAIYPVPNSNQHFVFSENADFFSDETAWYKEPTVIFILTLTFSIVFILSVAIYLPLRQLQKQTQTFQQTQRKFGLGKLSERANEQVPEPIKKLSQSFNKMADEIESRVIQSQIFAQAIPHEVRTPLSRIQLVNDLLRIKSQAENTELHDDIDTYIDDINNLTSNIIMLSKLTSMESSFYETHKSNINMSVYLRSRVESLPKNNIRITRDITEDIVLRCDSTMARLVIDNLVKNAIKYTHSHVHISLKEHQEYVEITVEDNGSGIPRCKYKEVFLPFSRLDKSRNSKTGGFGLGLAIASAAAHRSHLAIEIKESTLSGTQFSIIIPTES